MSSYDQRGFVLIHLSDTRMGLWLRHIESKKLVKVANDPIDCLLVNDGQGSFLVDKFWYQLATPMAGERWHFMKCTYHSQLNEAFFKFESDPEQDWTCERVICGCLQPINFGKGCR